jgi:hypothetical protein
LRERDLEPPRPTLTESFAQGSEQPDLRLVAQGAVTGIDLE